MSTIINRFNTKFVILTDISILVAIGLMVKFLITVKLSNPKILTLLKLFGN